MENLDFTSENVINCVQNEPVLWDTECTDVYPAIPVLHVSTLEAECTISVSVSDIPWSVFVSSWSLTSSRHLNSDNERSASNDCGVCVLHNTKDRSSF